MRQGLAFHIQQNDYFGAFATVLDLCARTSRDNGTPAMPKHSRAYATSSCVCSVPTELKS
jgi:hypothetical protein